MQIAKVDEKHKTSMQYVDTIQEARLRNGSKNSHMDFIEDIGEKIYWVYYIHLPYYLMTSFDSFCLHVFFLVIFSLSFFGLIKYCFL